MARNISLLCLCMLIASTTVLSGVTSAGLVGWWKFDETSGNVAKDSSGQGNDGTVVGAAQWVAGKIDGAFQFNGSTYINCGNKPSLNVRDQITMAFWFKVQAFSNTWEAFLAKGDGAYRASRSNGTGDSVHMGISGGNYFDATTIVTGGQWHHYCGTYDGATAKIYIDGKLDAFRQYGGQIGDSSTYNLYIGENQQATGRQLHGLLDDVRIFDKALNEQQIQDLIAKGASPTWNKAEKPSPADGTVGVAAPLFQWSKGETAVFHSLYLGTSPNLTDADLKAVRQPMTIYYHIPGLTPGTTYYWRVDEIDKDGVTVYPGDVWTFTAQALTAYYPTPADGSNTASPKPTLTWMAGAGATQHHLYFGNSLDAVTQGAAGTDKGTLGLTDATFAPGALDSLTTYYWRVDEVTLGNTIKTGPVWKFTTALPIDDFESYTDKAGGEIFSTWIDGYINKTGSTVGNATAPFAEQKIVHGGLQAMPLDYNNVTAPFYSEAKLEFPTAQDWTSQGTDTLVLFVRGYLTNSPGSLYIAVADTSQKVAVVAYPDPGIVTSTKWAEWRIPLSSLTGVNSAKVKALYIGIGDRANPVKGGTGRVYVDDICLTKP